MQKNKTRSESQKGRACYQINKYGEPTRKLNKNELLHLEGLRAEGWLWGQIAKAAGWSQGNLSRVVRHGKGAPYESILRLLKVCGPPLTMAKKREEKR